MSIPPCTDRRLRHLTVLLALAGSVLLSTGPALAAGNGGQSNRPPPIHVHSDDADFSQKSDVSTYTGNVKLTRRGLTLTGNKLVVTHATHKGRVKAVLTGNPAHIHKVPDADDDKVVTGHAHQIEYHNATSLIILRGDADVIRDGDRVQGSVVTYNVDNGATHAKRGKGKNERVHITIQPSGNNTQ